MLSISGIQVDFPNITFTPSPEANYILNWLRLQRITNRMTHWVKSQPTVPTHKAFQSKLLETATAFSWSDPEDFDAVEQEARKIATATILQRLEQSGLPPPRDLEPHITHLLSANPNILRVAEERVTARVNAAREILTQ